MLTIVFILHVIVCITLIMIVLLQTGKGAGIGAAFGGTTQTVFGSTGTTSFLGKLTTAFAIIFMLTSFFLAIHYRYEKSSSIMTDVKPNTQKEVPADVQERQGQESSPPSDSSTKN